MRCQSIIGIRSWILTVALIIAHSQFARAQLIPANRLIPWTPGVYVGVPGGPQTNRPVTITVTAAPYLADNTGVHDCSASINAAIQACPSNGVVYLPAGTYLLSNTLSITQSYITLRGAGSNTLVNLAGNTGLAYVGSGSDWNWAFPSSTCYITSGLTKGSTTLGLSNTTGFVPGQILQIQLYNDTNLPVVSVSGYNGLRRQKTLITGVTGNTLSIFPGLYDNYSNVVALAQMARYQSVNVGIENLSVNATNATGSFVIELEQCYGCWVKGVHSMQAYNYHIYLYDCLQCEVRECFMDTLNHVGTDGAGFIMQTSSGCLVEDNIVYKGFPLMEINAGSSGNVFGYNLCENSTTYGVTGAAIDSNHGPHNSFNLYEGNVSPNIQSDGYFGSDSHDTIYRNLLHATSPGGNPGASIILNRFARDYTIMGNILGTNGLPTGTYSFGYPNMGNGTFSGYAPPWANWGQTPGPNGFQEMDTNVQATTLLAGNYNYLSNSIPVGESLGANILPPSLYLTGKPAWFGNLTWPPFDPTVANLLPSKASIPAGYVFFNNAAPPAGPAGPPAPIILPNSVLTPSPN
jgi:hypothetical protein